MDNQFRHDINSTYERDYSIRIRWEKTRKFLQPFPTGKIGLDLGGRTVFTDTLEDYFGFPFQNTMFDLDVDQIEGKYDIITSFEVIEHLFNPLFNLQQVRKALSNDGRLYLSTPAFKPRLLQSPQHFHEMPSRIIYALFDRAEFTIIREKKFIIRPIWCYFMGIRPVMRGIFERIRVFELAKADGSFRK